MFLAYVVRLLPEPLARGVFSGVVEVVDSGRRHGFEDLDELVEVLREGHHAEPESDRDQRHEADIPRAHGALD